MNLKIVFEFLLDLKFNNNRLWFKENDARYREAHAAFSGFVEEIIPNLKQFDKEIDITSAKECMYRIYRDVRFSKNKEPYKNNFGASLAKGGRKSINAGYYLHFEPDNSFIGGGIYMPDPLVLKAIRTEIFKNTESYKMIINNTKFKNLFPEIFGDRLKTAPKGFPKDFEDIELLKNKHYVVTTRIENDFWFKKDVVKNVLNIFKVQYEFNKFLNNCIANI